MGVRTRGLDIKAGAAKLKWARAARLEAELVIDRWNRRLATGRDMLWSPTIRAALVAGWGRPPRESAMNRCSAGLYPGDGGLWGSSARGRGPATSRLRLPSCSYNASKAPATIMKGRYQNSSGMFASYRYPPRSATIVLVTFSLRSKFCAIQAYRSAIVRCVLAISGWPDLASFACFSAFFR
jgi:hypothetical protein